MATAFNALPSMKRYNLTAAFSGTTVATFTITFSPLLPVTDLVQIIPTSLNAAGTFEIGSSAVTTPGIDGFTNSGSSFCIDVYGVCMNDMHILPNGTIEVYNNFEH